MKPMRSVLSLLAAGAATLFSTFAFAADLPIAPPPAYAPPPPADFGGWYLRGDIGFSNQSMKSIRKSNLDYSQFSSINETNTFDAAGIFDVGIGYRVNSWFRTDFTAQYRGKSNYKGTDVVAGTIPGYGTWHEQDNYNASKSELLFLANAYVDLGTWWCVTPFVGAGIGASRVNISGFTDNGVSDLQPGAPGGPPIASNATAGNAAKWNFAWAAHAGLAYHVTPNVTLELAYSYVDLGSGTTGSISDFQGNNYGNVYKFNNITSNDLKLGVRWDLDTPPPPQPVLYRKG